MRRVEAGAIRLVLDLSGTEYISSVGLGVLVVVNKRVTEAKGRVVFCNLRESIQQLFDTTGLVGLLEVRADCAEALASLATT
jgi:anti-anti-sigma factor